ncbi:sugar phosphate isomerase/epimerase family protein [Paenibacillus sp. GCM10023248]|uniref:sugar phosphate isomerase/epimerase family protein n=1 Tax=unclassified Paenibacillus TaxID=185978 RepID=UPI002378BB3F|nr:sugar phosphate isomerase/epimerase family protein [Paenibacillus sp. MAHUQ-63]MDD9268485.1 sugar phosphate isomerase/epimerase [Paenibacillus sp. MAHUQ-63]
MRLSTSTNFFAYRLNGEYTPFAEALRRCKAAGFQVLDINFCAALNGASDLAQDNWRELIEQLRAEADKLGVVFTQSHPVFLMGHVGRHSSETLEIYREMMRRSIEASSILGVKWAVLHPIPGKPEADFDEATIIRENLAFHGPALELAKKCGVGIAFENMIERSTRRFSSRAAELVSLIDRINDPGVGACWDFGHSNFITKDQRDELRLLGKRLKATHVNDNYGKEDEHMLPFHGSVEWHTLLPVLAEIGYEGDFTFETHNEFTRLPEHLKDIVAKTAYEIGMYCTSLIK